MMVLVDGLEHSYTNSRKTKMPTILSALWCVVFNIYKYGYKIAYYTEHKSIYICEKSERGEKREKNRTRLEENKRKTKLNNLVVVMVVGLCILHYSNYTWCYKPKLINMFASFSMV